MSLATRCTACGTVFRVVRDQLRVSEGWVRCGRCQEVFNALENLFDLQREAPPPWAPSTASAGLAPPSVAPDTATDEPPDLQPDSLLHQETQPASTLTGDSTVPTESMLDNGTGFADARFPSEWPEESVMPSDATAAAAPSEPPDSETPAEPAPEFVRRAERAQRWQRPWARALLSLAALVLLLTLAGQAVYRLHDWIAALWPETRPALQALCERLACRIEPLRRIDSIAVDSSGLTRVSAMEAYKLSLVLRNRSGIPVALPSVDLSLTDPQGQLVARRVLSPAELGATQSVLAPGAEAPLQATLTAGDRRLLGYTIEVFYP
jgi:predicted Zn finger-like uncharacterized protein